VLIVQISDCHLTPEACKAYGRVDTNACLRLAIEAIRALPLQPDVVLATGDLAQTGAPEEYERFREILRGLAAPVLPVAGNHDQRETMAQALDLGVRFDLSSDFIQYAVDDFPVRILVLDTITPGSGEPSFCADRLAWTQARLAEDRRPTLIAMHHPPFPAGVAWMEPRSPDWAAPLARLVERCPHVVRLVCGHVHRPMTTLWAGACAMSAPSTAHQVFPDLSPAGDPLFNFEAPGLLLHHWAGGVMRSYGVAIPGMADTFPLRLKEAVVEPSQ
jgi:3',5'-cyclic AMP phosphodiesterase CpdA